MRVRLLGVGMGPQHVTVEVAMRCASCDYVVAASKGDDDELLAIRQAICDEYGVELVRVPDPMRDRRPGRLPGHGRATGTTPAPRRTREVIRERGGTAAFLVWGDPSLYDSTIRVVERVAAAVGAEWDVLPGVSAPSLLAARHRIVLHEVGEPVHITSARRLPEALAAGQTNIVVMLGNEADLRARRARGLVDLVGRQPRHTARGARRRDGSATCCPISTPRAPVPGEAAGWVMDAYLLRAPA